MNISRRLVLLLFLILLPGTGWSQGSLFLHGTSGAVHMRWNAPLGEDFEGFHVERQTEAGGGWERLTEDPVTPIYDVARIRQLMGKNADTYLAFFDPGAAQISAGEQRSVVGDPFAKSLIQLQSVRFPEMGEVLGERYQDRALKPGESFRYRVIRISGGAESPWAESARAIVHGVSDEVPMPEDLTGEGDEESAMLTWKFDKALSSQGRLVSFTAYRAESPSGPYEPANYDPIIPTQINGKLPEFIYIDRYLENGKPYWYRLAGRNVLGFESAQTEAIKILPRDLEAPPTPQDFRGRLHGEGAMLQWRPVSVPDLEGYSVFRSEEPEGPFEAIWPGPDQPAVPRISYIDADVPEGAIYYYFVAAVDSSQNVSLPSDRIQIFRPDETPPAQVQGLKAEAIDEGSEPGVHLTWTANAEADLSGYIVQRTGRVTGRGEDTQVAGEFYGENITPLTEPRYVDPIPSKSETRYAYRVVARDEAGNRSEPSEVVIAQMPDKVAPTRPAIWQARVEGGEVAVTWQANIEADLAGYRIYRSEDDKSFAPLNTEPVSGLRFADSTGTQDVIYHYRLTAVDETGNESEPSQSLSVKYLDLLAPEPPAIAAVELLEQGLEVTWGPVPDDVDQMFLYRVASDDPLEQIRTYPKVDARSFVDTQVVEGVEYRYFLIVADDESNVSDEGLSKSRIFERKEPSGE